MTAHTIQLTGSATASCGNASYTANGNSHGPIAPLVRQLIADGVIASGDTVEVRRGSVLCFEPRPAQRWASTDVVDDVRRQMLWHRLAF